MSSLVNDLLTVGDIYARMEAVLDIPDERLRRRTGVSRWSAAEHLDHMLIANRWALSAIIAMMRGHGEFKVSGRLTTLGVVLLRFGRIPRGRGKAPATSRPDADAPIASMRERLRKQRGHLATIRDRSDEVAALKTRFEHPYFGCLRATDGVRFVRVHSDHHLRIVDEILADVES